MLVRCKLHYLATSLFLIAGLLTTFASAATERGKDTGLSAQGKKGRASAKSRNGRAAPSRKGKKGRRPAPEGNDLASQAIAPGPVVADRIEVIEHGSATSGDHANPANQLPRPSPGQGVNISTRRLETEIEPKRVIEIQQALAQKGFYTGQPTGLYDEVTIDAMRRFQASQQIDVTGYPTAHALKRLGLTHW
jgi:hypothetical protein